METNISNCNTTELSSATQIDFYHAMHDFKIMFPMMDDDVIEEVLRSNQGAVDSTINHLLTMTTDNLNEVLRHDLEKADESERNDLLKLYGTEKPDVTKNETDSSCNSLTSKKWSPPLLGPLPSTFLRIGPVGKKFCADFCEDERIALFLQNEEFLSELRVNQDFLSTLNQDIGDKGNQTSDIETFKERLRNMGKVSRNKFSQLSRLFQRRRKDRSVKGIFDDSSRGEARFSGEPLISDSQEQTVKKE